MPSELNDKWVKSLKRDEKTVSSLKKAIEKDLLTRKKTNAENKFNSTIISKVLEGSKLEIPKSMIDREAKDKLSKSNNKLNNTICLMSNYCNFKA